MTAQARIRRIGWFAALALCAVLYLMLHLKVHAVHSEVVRAERQIVHDRGDREHRERLESGEQSGAGFERHPGDVDERSPAVHPNEIGGPECLVSRVLLGDQRELSSFSLQR